MSMYTRPMSLLQSSGHPYGSWAYPSKTTEPSSCDENELGDETNTVGGCVFSLTVLDTTVL